VETEIVGVPAWRGQSTTLPCSEPGCQGPDRVTCDYRDRRGAPCPTAWCPEHIRQVGAWHLCRRHARVVEVLAPVEFRGQLPPPDIDNRAPSLAAYLAEQLDAPMRQLLGEICQTERDEHVATETLMLVTGPTGSRRWTESWKLYDSTGPLVRIGVEVEEATDPECAIRLNARVILRCVPPWIEERTSGAPATSPDEAETRRRAFFGAVMEQHVRPAVLAEERWVRRWERSHVALWS